MLEHSLKTRITILSILTTAFLLALPAADAAVFHYLGGVQDNYAPPPEPANPSASLQTYLSASSYRNYDVPGIDSWFADTFDRCPMCITGAELEIGLRPESLSNAGAINDTLRFGFTDNLGNQLGPYWIKNIGFPVAQQSILPLDWGTQNYPNGVVLNLNLASLPLGNSNANNSTANLIPALRQYKFLNVDVQDDTAVDFINLRITTALSGDVNGDGCVDALDLNLLAANFGQAPPAGVGDPNGDGVIDVLDLSLLQADFGKCCPEPAGVALFATALVGCLSVVRRRGSTMAKGRVRRRRRFAVLGCIAVAVVSFLTARDSMAATIVEYKIPQSGAGFTSIPPSSVDPSITASLLAATPTINPNTFGNHFYFFNWNSTVNLTKYYQNTLSVAAGKTLYLDDVSYSVEATTPPATFQVRSSLDGYTSIIDSFATNGAVITNRTSILTGLGPITGAVTFRFYATSASTVGRMGFANHLPGGTGQGIEIPGKSILFSGRVVPEPLSAGLLSLGILMAAAQRPRRRGVYSPLATMR